MMLIEESRFDHRTRYTVSMLDENGERTGTSRVVDPRVTRVIDDGHTYFLLRTTEGESDSLFYDYMNRVMMNRPIKTREVTATAMRHFRCFLEISRLRADALTPEAWQWLVYFILGEEFVPSGFKGSLTQRSVATANLYLVAIQMFLRKEGIHYDFLEEESFISRRVEFNGCVLTYGRTKDVFTLKGAAHGDDWVPNFVSPAQYKALLDVAARHDDRAALILLPLMYIYGLRLGECLGLTQEDVVMYGNVSADRGPVPLLRLRNRLSDKDWQRAKRLPLMVKDEFKGLGPRTYVLLTRKFFDQLQEYIQDTFTDITLRHPDRLKLAEASILTDDFDLDANHYIFFNRYSEPLADAAWSSRLKKYFVEAGIVVDRGRKQVNLSHQLRHGCAMLLYRFLPKDKRLNDEQLRRYLRHKRLESGFVYKRPTPFEEYVMLEGLQEDMARELPFINDGYEFLYREWREKNYSLTAPEGYDFDVPDAGENFTLDEIIDDTE